MKRYLSFLCLFIAGLSVIVSCSRNDNLRDSTAIAYITNHFNHSHYEEHLTMLGVKIVDERVIHERVFDMEIHTLMLQVTVDIKENYVVSKMKYGNFLEINRSWSEEAKMRINEADSEEAVERVRENYSEYAFEKGVQTINVKLRLTWNETEGRWMVLSMYI